MSETSTKLARVDIIRLRWQRFWGNVAIFPLGGAIVLILIIIRRYRIENIKEIRRQYRDVMLSGRPVLICANHLTLIDSVVMQWAFASQLRYLFNYRWFSWNVPAVENFKQKLGRRIITYVGKCVPIDRWGSREHTDGVLARISYLMSEGEPFTVFPEGTRSRSGRIEIENVTYGVGQMVMDTPGCQVLCVYMRGNKQDSYSDVPPRGSRFNLDLKLFEPRTELGGRRGQREIAIQIIGKLKEMEIRYFTTHPTAHGATAHGAPN